MLLHRITGDGSDFVLVLEDLTPSAIVDQVAGATPEQASQALEQASALHGSSWGSPRISAGWLPAERVWGALADSVPELTAPWLERFGSHLTQEQVNAVEQLGTYAGRWAATLTEHQSLWHGDFRLDNVLFEGRSGAVPVTVVDWQSAATGPGTIDVSYFLGNSMTTEDRSRHERDLVTEYHQRLRTHGLEDFTFDRLWREYRLMRSSG